MSDILLEIAIKSSCERTKSASKPSLKQASIASAKQTLIDSAFCIPSAGWMSQFFFLPSFLSSSLSSSSSFFFLLLLLLLLFVDSRKEEKIFERGADCVFRVYSKSSDQLHHL